MNRLSTYAVVAFLLFGCRPSPSTDDTSAALDTLAYVGGETCAECHAAEAEAWTGSDHDLAMARPSPETVLGDFGGATFSECGVETHFYTENGSYFIRTQGPAGEMQTYPVKYTFGYDPLQQYLIPLSKGRIQAFTVAWDAKKEQWFSLYPDECVEPDEWLHWTGDAMNWNYMCADCHSTNLRRNFDLASDTYETSYSEIDVSCEACHGPGERHVELARTDDYGRVSGLTVDLGSGALEEVAAHEKVESTRDEDAAFGDTDAGTAQRLKRARGPGHAEVETCAPCHSRRRIVYPNHLPGKAFLDHFEPELLEEELYFADGQIQDEVYVYGSFLQSKMYASHVRCSDCHDPHSTKLRREGNALCGQCHAPKQYDTFEHIRHEEGTNGSECVDCHMPERTYMVIDPRRDHSFQIPRPDLTADIGTPNACNGCHQDQSSRWAAERIEEWRGPERPETFARAFAGGREMRSEAEAELIRIVVEGELPDIVRATALSLLDRYPTVRARESAKQALEDEGALVRATAVRNLSSANDRDAVPLIEPLLRDSVRLVRTEAARVITQLAPGRYDRASESETAAAYAEALEEYRAGQLALSDQSASHLNLALIHENLGDLTAAEKAYRTAVRLDSSFVPAHMNVALLYDRRRAEAVEAGRAEEARELFERAEEALSRAVRLEPDMAQAHYSLGLLLAERPDRLEEAADHLGTAAELDSTNARVQYNAGLAYQRVGRAATAERLLGKALRLAPDHPDYINALSIFYAQQERWEEALRYTNRILQHYPNNRDLQQRRAYIQRQLGG